MEKGLGADFYKLPRATAMRTLSEVRARTVWILKLFSERRKGRGSQVGEAKLGSQDKSEEAATSLPGASGDLEKDEKEKKGGCEA